MHHLLYRYYIVFYIEVRPAEPWLSVYVLCSKLRTKLDDRGATYHELLVTSKEYGRQTYK